MSLLTVVLLILLLILLVFSLYAMLASLYNLWPFAQVESAQFTQLENVNIVFDQLNEPFVENLFVVPSRNECEQRCANRSDCEGYTYVNDPNKSDYRVCLITTNKNITQVEQANIQSGIKIR